MPRFRQSGKDAGPAGHADGRRDEGILKFDLGSISEDFYPLGNPNGYLDTEDILSAEQRFDRQGPGVNHRREGNKHIYQYHKHRHQ